MATLTIDADAAVGTAGIVPVLIYLSDLNGKRIPGTTGGSVTVATRTLRTDATGQLTVDLPPTATITPPGSFYTVQVNGERFLIIKGSGTETLVQAAGAVGSPVELPEGSRFNDLADVNAPNPINGQVPVFDAATNSWLPGTVSGSGLTPAPDLTVLGNVSGTSAVPSPLTSSQQRTAAGLGNSATRNVGVTSGDVAAGDAPTAAQAAAIASSAASLAATTLDNLADVNATAPTFEQTTVWNPVLSKWVLSDRMRTAVQRTAEPLRAWFAKWATIRTAPAIVVMLGASETWSFGSSMNATDGLTDNVRTALSSQAAFPAAGQGWIPAYSDSGTDLGSGNVYPYAWGRSSGSGTPYTPAGVQDPLSGLGGWGLALTAGQAPPADTKTCTGVDLYFTVQKTAPAASVQLVVDGTPTGSVVSTLDVTIPAGTKQSGRKLLSWTGTGTHSFTFVVTGSGTAIFDGGYIHNGTELVGPQVHSGGHGGAEFADFIAGGVYYDGSIDHIKNVQPALVIVTFGLNDAFKGKTFTQAQTAMVTLVNGIKAVAPNVSVLINFEWRGGIVTKTPPSLTSWLNDWRPAMQYAADTLGAAFLDWFEILGDLYLPGGATDVNSVLFSDALHPNPKGYKLVSNAIVDKIVPSSVALQPRNAHLNPVPSCASMGTVQQSIPSAVWTPIALQTNVALLDTDSQHPLTAVSTTIAAGSNGAVLPQATINVASTTGFPAGSASRPRYAVINGPIAASTLTIFSYTGMTATSFTGCALAVTGGTMATGQVVTPANESVVFNTAGSYNSVGTVTFAQHATGIRGVRLNMWRSDFSLAFPGGTTVVPTFGVGGPVLQTLQAVAPHTITAGFKAVSFLRLEAYQTSGANMTLPLDLVQAPALSACWLGPAVDGV